MLGGNDLRRRVSLALLLLFLVLLTAGCSTPNNPEPIPGKWSQATGIWDKYFIYPLNSLLEYSYQLVGNYGWAILIMTIVIRLILVPLMVKQIRSSKQMQEIQPELQEIREKYKKDPQKQQMETMKVMQKYNINPMAGCLPALVQMPILIALYQTFIRNEHIFAGEFLWLQLGTPDPYYILPILAAVFTYLQQKMMGAAMNNNPQMKTMMMVMPVMIFFIAIGLPSALSLYWVYGNIFTIIQTYFTKGLREGGKTEQGAKTK